MSEQVIEFEVPSQEQTQPTDTEVKIDVDVATTDTNVDTVDPEEKFDPLEYLKGGEVTIDNPTTTDTEVQTTTQDPAPQATVSQEKDAYTWAEANKRSPEEYFQLHKDWEKEDGDLALRTYLKEKNKHWTAEDIQDEIDDKYAVDPIADDPEKAERKAKRLYNDDVAAAKEYLKKNFSEAVKQDAEPQVEIPEEYKEAMSVVQQQREFAQKAEQGRQHYLDTLNESYQDFNGFDYSFEVTNVDGTKQDVQISFVPSKSTLQETIDIQKDTNKLFDRFGKFEDDGSFRFTDGKGFMKTIAAAANINQLMQLAYEQGAASNVENLIKNDLKNVNISTPSKQNTSSSGVTFSVEK